MIKTQSRQRPDMPADHPQKNSLQPNAVLGISIGIVLPAIGYQVLTNVVHMPTALALALCSLPGTIWWFFWLIVLRKFDLLASLAPLFLIINSLLLISHAEQRIAQLNTSFASGVVGLFCVLALFFPQSLLISQARLLTTGDSPRKRTQFHTLWQVSAFRTRMRFCVMLWGGLLVLEAIVTTLLGLRLSPSTMATVLPWLNYGLPIVLANVTIAFWYRALRQQSSSSTA